ncbi:other nek protein kinase [Moniliophthora roreri]|uniref:non-specific serine/threonine protein kinase n=1 Tax=Moniliophthora roreri TaxID=221103 RepID=A0A0W0FX85_MONRR|nr:other nek protein kinase [Moniliophthora roreri]
MATPFLEQYEPLDVIGNGSFGIIRKVRRKSDGSIYARKELNFERMSERDRKQIVAEVNILKELNHEHIVRYHDRYVDRDAGILYILMEYCGGGDLSSVIKQAQRHNRPVPEDTIWNYFMQILLALQHCHHPNGHGRNGSGGTGQAGGFEENQRRTQILHRDLKPDNVFLDECNTVKLGDFGLSKALPQTSFANTYVGTPYYMSPELMQEKAYDSKSDIWSLGCLIYELCALKPPFHEAKTHAELSILIRNGRIPPLPKGYSQSLGAVIKAMLNLNPAMRPSAAQLLQNERLDLVLKISEAEKMFATVKSHKANILARERELVNRENALKEREQQLQVVVSQKDTEIASLQQALVQAQSQPQNIYSQSDLEQAIREAIARREQELRVLVLKREEEVAAAMAKREEEIIASVNKREKELNDAWASREEQMRKEVEERTRWVDERANWVEERAKWIETREGELNEVENWLEGVRTELEEEEKRLDEARIAMEESVKKLDENNSKTKGRAGKNPLEEVKNLLNTPEENTPTVNTKPSKVQKPRSPSPFPGLATPAPPPSRATARALPPASAMKGVIMTSTGEVLATPGPGTVPLTPSPPGPATVSTGLPSVDLTKLFVESPKVGLDFGKIFDSRDDVGNAGADAVAGEGLATGWEGVRKLSPEVDHETDDDEDEESPPPSPSWRKERELQRTSGAHSWGREASTRRDRTRESESDKEKSTGSTPSSAQPQSGAASAPPTRIRRPSIRRRQTGGASSLPGSVSDPALNGASSHQQQQKPVLVPLPLPHPHLHSTGSQETPTATKARSRRAMQRTQSAPATDYDIADEENLPSPFLKRTERQRERERSSSTANLGNATGTVAGRKRISNGNNLLRTVAAVNSAAAHAAAMTPSSGSGTQGAKPSTTSARKASEDARKALFR